MDHKRGFVLVAVALLVLSAGCVGVFNTDGEPTTTAPETTATPTPTTDAPPDTTTTTTTEPTTTTTTEPTPQFTTKLYRQGEGAIRDGTATYTLDVTNTGAGGEYEYTIQVERRSGGSFDRTVSGTVDAGAKTVESRTLRVEFQATGTYDVTLNGEHVASIEVRGLGTGSGGGSGGESDDGANAGVTVEGEVSVE